MKATTKSGRGKHLFVDGSDPICAVILRPKSLRAWEVAPVHRGAASVGRLLRCCCVRTQQTMNRPRTCTPFAHLAKGQPRR